MDKRIWIGIAVVALVAVALALPLFLPKSGMTFDDAAPEGAAVGPPTPLTGRDGHAASGTVQLLATDGGYMLRFEDVQQTQGPDVYLYLTREPDATDKSAVTAGLKVLLPQDSDGQFTARGSFNVPLPADFDPEAWGGITTWCDRFGVPFSSAAI